MAERMRVMYYLVQYEGSSVYEPAEGGYYIPILEESAVSTCKYGYKHALRAFKQAVEDMTEIYGKPDVLTKKYAHWTTCDGDVELHIENERRVGCHEVKYYGYC